MPHQSEIFNIGNILNYLDMRDCSRKEGTALYLGGRRRKKKFYLYEL